MQRILASLATAGLLTVAVVAGTTGPASAHRLETEPIAPHSTPR